MSSLETNLLAQCKPRLPMRPQSEVIYSPHPKRKSVVVINIDSLQANLTEYDLPPSRSRPERWPFPRLLCAVMIFTSLLGVAIMCSAQSNGNMERHRMTFAEWRARLTNSFKSWSASFSGSPQKSSTFRPPPPAPAVPQFVRRNSAPGSTQRYAQQRYTQHAQATQTVGVPTQRTNYIVQDKHGHWYPVYWYPARGQFVYFPAGAMSTALQAVLQEQLSPLPDLPPGWFTDMDYKSGRLCYVDNTGRTTWDNPLQPTRQVRSYSAQQQPASVPTRTKRKPPPAYAKSWPKTTKPPPGSVPDKWEIRIMKKLGKTYTFYINPHLKVTQWEHPTITSSSEGKHVYICKGQKDQIGKTGTITDFSTDISGDKTMSVKADKKFGEGTIFHCLIADAVIID